MRNPGCHPLRLLNEVSSGGTFAAVITKKIG
jgi:hypothetical protein